MKNIFTSKIFSTTFFFKVYRMKHERLWTLGNKLRALGVGWDRLVMGIKEGTYCMVHWVLYASNESWNFTSKTRDELYGD